MSAAPTLPLALGASSCSYSRSVRLGALARARGLAEQVARLVALPGLAVEVHGQRREQASRAGGGPARGARPVQSQSTDPDCARVSASRTRRSCSCRCCSCRELQRARRCMRPRPPRAPQAVPPLVPCAGAAVPAVRPRACRCAAAVSAGAGPLVLAQLPPVPATAPEADALLPPLLQRAAASSGRELGPPTPLRAGAGAGAGGAPLPCSAAVCRLRAGELDRVGAQLHLTLWPASAVETATATAQRGGHAARDVTATVPPVPASAGPAQLLTLSPRFDA